MDWKRTEIIFILTFLILDIFLAAMFFNKQLTNDPDKLGNYTLEEHLKTDNIIYPDLSNKEEKGEIFTAERKAFRLADLPFQENQTIELQDNHKVLFSILKKPVKISNLGHTKEMADFLKEKVYKGSSYEFWRYDKENNTLIYNQVMEENPVLFDSNGQIKFQLNNDNEIVSYQQTMLNKQDNLKEKKDLLSAFEALEVLYQHGDLKIDSTVKKAIFGYYTTVQLSSGNVYFPVWSFEVKYKDKTEYILVNAKDEQVINMNDNRTVNKANKKMVGSEDATK